MYPRYFSRTVNVMGSILSTGLECMFSVHTVWSNGGNENGGFSGKIAHFGIVEVAYFDGYVGTLICECIFCSGSTKHCCELLFGSCGGNVTMKRIMRENEISLSIPGWTRSGFNSMQVAATASNLLSDRPEIAHLVSLGRCVAI